VYQPQERYRESQQSAAEAVIYEELPEVVPQCDALHEIYGRGQGDWPVGDGCEWWVDDRTGFCESEHPEQPEQPEQPVQAAENPEQPERPLRLHAGPIDLARSNRRAQKNKLWCHLYLDDAMLIKGFDMNKKIIGHGGQNTRRIYELTDAKIRLRGRGSGHMEENGREAPVHLMLAVTTSLNQRNSFALAVAMSLELLQSLSQQWSRFCKRQGLPAAEAAPFWLGDISPQGRSCLEDASNTAQWSESLNALSLIL